MCHASSSKQSEQHIMFLQSEQHIMFLQSEQHIMFLQSEQHIMFLQYEQHIMFLQYEQHIMFLQYEQHIMFLLLLLPCCMMTYTFCSLMVFDSWGIGLCGCGIFNGMNTMVGWGWR